jgi:hypothetical protein
MRHTTKDAINKHEASTNKEIRNKQYTERDAVLLIGITPRFTEEIGHGNQISLPVK